MADKPTSASLTLADFNPDMRLDTGMKASEAITRASQWWDTKGARMMQTEAKRQRQPLGGPDKGMGQQFAVLNPDDANFMPSRVLAGFPWDDLDRREKLAVVKAWHHRFVRVPDIIGKGKPQ